MLRGHKATVTSIAFSSASNSAVTASIDGTVRIWDLDIETLMDRARRLTGRELTPEERMQYIVPDHEQVLAESDN